MIVVKKFSKFLALLVLCVVTIVACDPTKDQLTKGKNFNPGIIIGKIVKMEIGYYEENSEINGYPYYVVTVDTNYRNGITSSENPVIYKGVPEHIFKNLYEGMVLPTLPIIRDDDLEKMEGVIVDKYRNNKGDYFVTVKSAGEYTEYRVSPRAYFEHLETGMKLPFSFGIEK